MSLVDFIVPGAITLAVKRRTEKAEVPILGRFGKLASIPASIATVAVAGMFFNRGSATIGGILAFLADEVLMPKKGVDASTTTVTDKVVNVTDKFGYDESKPYLPTNLDPQMWQAAGEEVSETVATVEKQAGEFIYGAYDPVNPAMPTNQEIWSQSWGDVAGGVYGYLTGT